MLSKRIYEGKRKKETGFWGAGVEEKVEKEKLENLLFQGLRERVYPGAVLTVLFREEEVFSLSVGNASLMPNIVPMDRRTIFDLASLTKPLATTLALMKLVDEGKLNVDQPLGQLIPAMQEYGKGEMTTRHLLSHSSGLKEWEPFYSRLTHIPLEDRKSQVRQWILESPLLFPCGTRTLYSDLGFILLEWIAEQLTRTPLDQFLQKECYTPLGLGNLFLYERSRAANVSKNAFAATELCPWRKRIIQSEVHDENAFAMGGYSGHAGLFGTAAEVAEIGAFLLRCYHGSPDEILRPNTVRPFFLRQQKPENTTWALGWDTPSRVGSSTGGSFSEKSVGHLGFTGTSLWMDLDKEVVVAFLTNRIHPSRENEKIKKFRPQLHRCVMEILGFARQRGSNNG